MRKLGVLDVRTGKTSEIEVTDEEATRLLEGQFKYKVLQTITQLGELTGIEPARAAIIVSEIGDNMIKIAHEQGFTSEAPKQYGHYV